MKFSTSLSLPKYLENALAPFSWSGILSDKLRSSVLSCILCEPDKRIEVTEDFLKSLSVVGFLSEAWKLQLTTALLRFAKEGFK